MADLKRAIGTRVRELRTMRGLSQAALATASEVSQPTICDIESGKTGLRVTTAEKVAAALGVTVSELLNGLSDRKAG
jgi:transcriptional regulator with XRE-family HTH domain